MPNKRPVVLPGELVGKTIEKFVQYGGTDVVIIFTDGTGIVTEYEVTLDIPGFDPTITHESYWLTDKQVEGYRDNG